MGQGLEVMMGNPELLGVEHRDEGVNFAVTVPDDEPAELIITNFEGNEIISTIDLPVEERIGEVATVFVKGYKPSEMGYYYRVKGKTVLDRMALRIRDGICYVETSEFDWQGVKSPEIPVRKLQIYKLHVRGFSAKMKECGAKRGTFAAITESIPYFKSLSVTAIEFMPFYEWDSTLKVQPYQHMTPAEYEVRCAAPPKNYWGYAKKNFYYAPKEEFASGDDSVAELKTMIRELHRAGIEVIMEIYFSEEMDPYTAQLVVRHWKSEYHIDGFHLVGPAVDVKTIVNDPLLKKTKLFFDYVDNHDLYKGDVPKFRHVFEYNEEFEHVGRGFLKGDEGQLGSFVSRSRRNPATHGIVNYMANTNGFTLFDTVSYNKKHNEANGEKNEDGTTLNFSWNCGVEGTTDREEINDLRSKQIKNALAYVYFAQGVPLLNSGDECGNTQLGNNNAYCADNEVGWKDWDTTSLACDLFDFTKKLAAFRAAHPILHMNRELRGTDYASFGYPDISFHDSKAWYYSLENHTIGVMLCGKYAVKEGENADDFIFIAYNSYWDEYEFALPQLPGGYSWYDIMSTARPAGVEFTEPGWNSLAADQKSMVLPARSVTVFAGVSIPEIEEELFRLAEIRRVEEEKRREEERLKAEEERRREEERLKAEEERRREEEARKEAEIETASALKVEVETAKEAQTDESITAPEDDHKAP